jgi:hypothetical protein
MEPSINDGKLGGRLDDQLAPETAQVDDLRQGSGGAGKIRLSAGGKTQTDSLRYHARRVLRQRSF